MAPHVHSFAAGENKVNKIANWLTEWIKNNLKFGKIHYGDFLPSKGELAFHTGVSLGTIQNAFRQVEDTGLIESKQRIGTYIKDVLKSNNSQIKNISKRDEVASLLLNYFIENKYKIGDKIPSIRKIASEIGMTPATVRISIIYLTVQSVLKKINNSFFLNQLPYNQSVLNSKTLVVQIADEIKKYVANVKHKEEKLPSNKKLAELFNVSVKTIHDALKLLNKEGILYPRRGRYGTIITNDKNVQVYRYENVEIKIKQFISQQCEIGTKLPSIKQFSNEFDVSTKTVKKALDNLAQDGYVTYTRGRYGGTYVTDIPEAVEEAYKWLVLNPDFISNSSN